MKTYEITKENDLRLLKLYPNDKTLKKCVENEDKRRLIRGTAQSTLSSGIGDIEISMGGCTEDEDDYELEVRFYQESLLGYIETFKQLPLIGMHLSSGLNTCGQISQINFNGIDNSIFLCVEYV